MFDQATELRLEALRLACAGGVDSGTVLVAQRFHDFLTGSTDKSPRQIIAEALERAGVT